MTEEQQQPTTEAIKQRKKENAKNAMRIDVAGVFKPDLQRVMKAHGINNQQDIHQGLPINLIGADFETQAGMLRCDTTRYEPSEKMLRELRTAGLQYFTKQPDEREDKIFAPG